jgi:pilus assembly protein CpaC
MEVDGVLTRDGMRRILAVAAIAAISLCSPRPVQADSVQLLSIQTGHSVLLKAEGLTRVAVGDGRIAGVVPIGTSQVVVNGKTAGHTTIMIWAHGARTSYEVTVTEQQLDDLGQMLRTAINEPNVQVVNFGHALVVRGTVPDGAHFQTVSDIIARFDKMKLGAAQGGDFSVVNAVTINRPLSEMQDAVAKLPGAANVRVEPDGKGNVIVSGNVPNARVAQEILDKARGLAGTYLATDGQMINRISTDTVSQVNIKVYVLEVDNTAQSQLGVLLQSGITQPGNSQVILAPPFFPLLETPRGPGQALTAGAFYRTTVLAPTINLLMTEGHARVLSSPDLVTLPGNQATFLVGGEIPIPYSTGLGQVSIIYKEFGVKLNATPTLLGNGAVETKVAPEVSALDFQDAVTVGGFVIPALKTSRLSTDVITQPGESIILGGLVERDQSKFINKFPVLGDLPILGKLFRSTQYQNRQSDVVFVLTPEVITR